jgi:hypothetical protein
MVRLGRIGTPGQLPAYVGRVAFSLLRELRELRGRNLNMGRGAGYDRGDGPTPWWV